MERSRKPFDKWVEEQTASTAEAHRPDEGEAEIEAEAKDAVAALQLQNKVAFRVFTKRYFDLEGRSSRGEFLIGTGFWFSCIFALIMAPRIFGDAPNLWMIQAGFMALTATPVLALLVRRFHDIDRSGWLALVVVMPPALSFALLRSDVIRIDSVPARYMIVIYSALAGCLVAVHFWLRQPAPKARTASATRRQIDAGRARAKQRHAFQ